MAGKVLETLRGRTTVVTGTNRGLGRALALAFAAEGARVVAHARRSEDLQGIATACREAGAEHVATVAGDLLDPDLGNRLARGAGDGADVLMLSAAVLGPMRHLLDTPREEFAGVMRINVDAQLDLLQALLPGMLRRRRGIVVGLSSGLGRFALPMYGAYTASKHALEGIVKTVACEHGPDGIVAVSVAPGMVETDMLRAALGRHDVSEFQSPGETARAFVRLLLDLTPERSGESLDVKPWL